MLSTRLLHIVVFYVAFLSSTSEKQSVLAFQTGIEQEQLVFHQQQQQQQQQASSNSILSPFSYEWIQLLEQFHNTLGHRNTSKDDDACLFPVPAFDCEPFIWHDAIVNRDAYHLRPNVCVKSNLLQKNKGK